MVEVAGRANDSVGNSVMSEGEATWRVDVRYLFFCLALRRTFLSAISYTGLASDKFYLVLPLQRLEILIKPPLFDPGEEGWIGIGWHDGGAVVSQDVECKQAALFGDVSCKPLAIS